jgi:hypothetical protein
MMSRVTLLMRQVIFNVWERRAIIPSTTTHTNTQLQFAPESTDDFLVIQSLTLCRVNQAAKHCQDKRKSLFFTASSTCTTTPPAPPLSLTAPVRLLRSSFCLSS